MIGSMGRWLKGWVLMMIYLIFWMELARRSNMAKINNKTRNLALDKIVRIIGIYSNKMRIILMSNWRILGMCRKK